VGGSPVDEADWGVLLHADGTLSAYKLNDLLATGSVASGETTNPILSFSVFHLPEEKG
jgi:hypothetical protein